MEDGDTYLSPHKSRDTAPVLPAHHPLPREISEVFPLKARLVPIGILSLTPEICTSKVVEAEAHRQVVSHHR